MVKGVDRKYIDIILPDMELDFEIIDKYKSPNFTKVKGFQPWVLVVHHTAGKYPYDLYTLMGKYGNDVSVHYYIRRNGYIYQLVSEDYAAWHAGRSSWKGNRGVNFFSIGIELESPIPELDYTNYQYVSLLKLSYDIVRRRNIALDDVVGHKDVSLSGKIDPSNFDLNDLRNDLKFLLDREWRKLEPKCELHL